MFIGEAPGRQEDLGAEPFIGAAGQHLNELLSLAGLTRSEIYIANVLKCRPPENRDPQPVEIEACSPFLREQVRAIAPQIIVTLGNFATRFILRTDRGISGLRGQIHITGPFSVLPIYHPAAAIYDRLKQPLLEDDFRLLGRLIETRRAERAERLKRSKSINSIEPVEQTNFCMISASPEETQAIGARLAVLLKPDDVLLLSGDLGTGKTEFAKGVALGLGISEAVSSPTFNLLLVHQLPTGALPDGIAGPNTDSKLPHSLYHFDLYRLETSDQLTDLDYFRLLEDGAISLVEWGDRFSDALPKDYMLIKLSVLEDGRHQLGFSAVGQQSLARLVEWQAANE
jgi:DNA polymerase